MFPAAGLDVQFFEGDRRFLTVGPYESEHVPHVNKEAEELDEEDLAPAKMPRAFLLKGLQSIVKPKDLRHFVELIKPRRVIACGTAKPRSPNTRGYPYIDQALREALANLGFHDRTSEHLPERAIALLRQAHGDLETYFAFGNEGGWFPLSQVEIYVR